MTLSFRALAFATAFGLSAAPALADVTIRYLANQGGLSLHELAAEPGYFDGTAAVLNAIAAGNDFVAAYPTNGLNDEAQSIFYVLEDSPIRDIRDIAGKTIAVNTLGAHLDYVVREALHQAGLPENAANLVVVPGPQLEQVLRSKQVDISAFGYWQTTFEGAARKAGGLRAVFDDTDVLGEIAGGFIVLRRDWIAAHPAEAKIFVDASIRALDHAREHPEETRAIFARVLGERGENPEVAQYFAGYGVREGGRPGTSSMPPAMRRR
ncbi:ABC transporter substrate-binding protein [Ruixingdingia sedimenti]|uniref:ABC transporter substrate-binding protein n=1 Tax=Ruixingdingia sedimenti TaxID=3073604 RepID=A0ABU1F438_9RHOB|nr:ABC transporter substrate-binding protein [Xinfangfangia sp. LG-4]MDR5651626.1 ABC transporter substrate-binding protein [Xinfangfangia sp. LG-4]